ncbi:ADP-ribose pyrophosphatase [Bombiscardovia nodaiensis]|uniref:ADP-ribose pyrophosphatase n=1 Tax=Bombiscardovia nodaiensis TaxID=2932181 RepID=A0ABN6SCE1_9BIFI|nr:ADP-ribose pyrophosphatase [Bombiscardovia nodaiensis]
MSSQIYRQFDPWRPSPVQEVSRQQVLKSHYFSVDQVNYLAVGDEPFERSILNEERGDTIAILALDAQGRIPLVEQYRLPTHRWTLEVPAGHPKNEQERPVDVAARKLQEEAGFRAEHFTQFARFINTPSFSNQHTSLFYAQGLTPTDRAHLGPETPRQEVRMYTLAEAYRMVIAGTILDAKSVIAILRAKNGFAELN